MSARFLSSPSSLRPRPWALLPLAALSTLPLRATTSTWGGGNGNTYAVGGNWTNVTVPNSVTAVARFTGSLSGGSFVLINSGVTVDSFVFAPEFTGGSLQARNPTSPFVVNFVGAGIVNQSTVAPRFTIGEDITVRFSGLNASLGLVRYEIETGGRLLLRASNNIDASSATVVLNGGSFGLTNGSDYGPLSVGALSGDGSVDLGPSPLTVGAANTSTTYAGTLTVDSLTKVGTGTWTLTGAQIYTGPTLISAGTVVIANPTGSAFGTGAVTVAAGATLTGAGSFSGAFQNHGLYAPGDSPTLATLSSFSQGSTGTLELELGGLARGTGYDALDISGSFLPDGTLVVLLIDGFTPASGDSFDLFDWGSITGSFAEVLLPTLAPGLAWDSSALYTTGTITVTGTAIPEPSTFAALAGLAALGAAATRRRRPA